MKQPQPRIVLPLFLTGLLGLGFASSEDDQAPAPGAAALAQPAGTSETRRLLRANFERVRLEEQLIRSDASAVMLGAWIEQRQSIEAMR